MKLFIILGAINAFIAVALGAFGAHALEGKVPDKYLETWKTGVTYEMFHAAGLMIIGLVSSKISGPLMTWSGWLMFIGIILFSGSLYILCVTQIKILGAITPLGGVSFLAAWVLLIIAVNKHL
ncbi:DUF423 domain-containing protein [Peribacillus cavernae]|uniref:DUF423 domain-containing protein n=1 Tax=Peribacillus cavernae TaxID=1674310 RepID=A0A3S0U5N9_9BACI|nr:DUF423 domain-containing protein [Peribacillus cavernae]MDQ0218560.1 uncharacterized membrane protein YgdD (TMEM256/DUF423 family) [Peribacillus cavernae]RUQ31550.1 DUF423 domain-containing protein [Peribacillus cavernae]